MNKLQRSLERVGALHVTFKFPCKIKNKNLYNIDDEIYSCTLTLELLDEITELNIPFIAITKSLNLRYRNYGHGYYFDDIDPKNPYMLDLSDIEKENINIYNLMNLVWTI